MALNPMDKKRKKKSKKETEASLTTLEVTRRKGSFSMTFWASPRLPQLKRSRRLTENSHFSSTQTRIQTMRRLLRISNNSQKPIRYLVMQKRESAMTGLETRKMVKMTLQVRLGLTLTNTTERCILRFLRMM